LGVSVLTLAAIWSAAFWLDSSLLKGKKPKRPRPRVKDYENQLKRFRARRIKYHLWQIGGTVIIAILLLISIVFAHNKWEQKELDKLNGRLLPANEPTPQILCLQNPPPTAAVEIFFGNSVAVVSQFPHTVISSNGVPRLGIDRGPDGSIGINAHVISIDGRIITEIKDSQFMVNPNNYLRLERKDKSSLSLLDQFGRMVLDVRYINPSAFLVSSFVLYTNAGDMLTLPPMNGPARICFFDKFGDPDKGDWDLSRTSGHPIPPFRSSPSVR
jgi:hypothetical protein